MSLKQKTLLGVFWSSIERFSVQGFQFLIQIVMARILLPSDYGVIGILIVFLAISQSIIDSGFSNALIQKKNRNELDYSTVFYFNIAIGIFLYALLFFLSPFIASFYNNPVLEPVMKVISINLLIYSLAVVPKAKLAVCIDFKTQAKASVLGVVFGGTVGIILAYTGYGVWAIVIQATVGAFIETLLLWILIRWKPLWSFSISSFKSLFSYGSKLLFSGLLETIYRHLYILVIGKKFPTQDLGFYTRGELFTQFPSSNLSIIMSRVSFPVLSEFQDDNEKLKYYYRKYLRASVYIIFPLMTGLCVLAEPLVSLVLTDKWLPCVALMQILCFAYIWFPIHTINLELLQVKGRSDLFLRLEIIKKIVGVIVLIITIPWGIKVMCGGLVFSSFISLFINSHYTKRVIGMGLSVQMKELLPIILLSFSMGGLVYGVGLLFTSSALQLFVGTTVGIIYYVVVSRIFKQNEVLDLLLSVKNKI